uniref:F-box domain-containing protein n=1 Tax=Strongyloides papillosus TaxID=174720 RepID=A0A0N5CGT8_STREA
MDLNNLGMDFSIKEEYFEVQDEISDLPDDVLVIILSKLSWEDVNTIKLVSRRFYGIVHRNYHRLERRMVRDFSIKYNEYCGRCPFHLQISFKSVGDRNSGVIQYGFPKSINIQSVGELTGFLKMFDMRKLRRFLVPAAGNLDVFSILGGLFQVGTKIRFLEIPKLAEKDFGSFQTFIEKISWVGFLTIKHLCAPSTEPRDVYSFLSLSSFKTIKFFEIRECNRTKILSPDFVTKLLRNSPDIRILDIGSMNIEFLEGAFKEFFGVEELPKMESECNLLCEKILFLRFNGEIEHLHGILKNVLSELRNEKEVTVTPDYSSSFYSDLQPYAIFESNVDCKNCLKNRHTITRKVFLHHMDFYGEELNY